VGLSNGKHFGPVACQPKALAKVYFAVKIHRPPDGYVQADSHLPPPPQTVRSLKRLITGRLLLPKAWRDNCR
jgi:hypothetical protein